MVIAFAQKQVNIVRTERDKKHLLNSILHLILTSSDKSQFYRKEHRMRHLDINYTLCSYELYVLILGTLGSNQEVIRFRWLIKYVSPALLTACSQPSGSVPNCPSTFEDIMGLEAAVAERVTRLISLFFFNADNYMLRSNY